MIQQQKIEAQSFEYDPDVDSNDHALIGVSPFNGYFSTKNMEVLFNWARDNFKTFNIFTMDKASKYNLMAIGYTEAEAVKKTRKYDRNLRNKVITCLKNVGFSEEDAENKILSLTHISKSQKYLELYKKYLGFFEQNPSFKSDCINASKNILLGKMEKVTNESLQLAIQYLFLELPIWFNIPDILEIPSSVLIYKDLSFYWSNIYCNYGFLSPNQKLLIKDITV